MEENVGFLNPSCEFYHFSQVSVFLSCAERWYLHALKKNATDADTFASGCFVATIRCLSG